MYVDSHANIVFQTLQKRYFSIKINRKKAPLRNAQHPCCIVLQAAAVEAGSPPPVTNEFAGKSGTLAIFLAENLHEVLPVTRGERFVLLNWMTCWEKDEHAFDDKVSFEYLSGGDWVLLTLRCKGSVQVALRMP